MTAKPAKKTTRGTAAVRKKPDVELAKLAGARKDVPSLVENPPEKKKRGRPKLSATVKAKRALEREAKRQAESTTHLADTSKPLYVDKKLEETGVATEKTGTELPLTGIPTPRGSAVCKTCERTLPKKQFQILKRATATSPTVYDSVCRACRAPQRAADLAASVFERKVQRRAGQILRKDKRTGKADPVVEEEAQRRADDMRESKRRASKKGNLAIKKKTINESATRELARRELARRRLLYFTQRFEGQEVDADGELVEIERAKGVGYKADWVHIDICARLERFLADARAGKQPRLMLFMPPRHGKSTLASRMFPAWAYGQDPTLEIIAASYGASLPEQFSRNVRGILRDPEYKAIFPATRLDPDRENVQGWATSKNGMYIPVGVGSGITGKGADILIIDDPFKGAEDAENPNQREKVVDWYFSEAYTRLSPNAGVLIILTRWHDADLAGALLSAQHEQETESREILDSEMAELEAAELTRTEKNKAVSIINASHKERMNDVENWEVVSFAAISEQKEYRMPDGKIIHHAHPEAKLLRGPGEALHPSRYPIDRLNKIRKNFYARGRQRFWHALYQQKPVPDEGIHFSREMVRLVTPHSEQVRNNWLKLSAWDLAAGQDAQHDWTVGAHGQMDHEGRIHVMELVRGRFDGAHGTSCEVLNEYERNRPHMIGVEKGPLEKYLMPSIKKELAERNKAMNYKNRLTPVFAEGKEYSLSPIQDPVLRAQPLQSLMQQGMLVFSKDLQWIEETISELIRFPGGVHDDIVTALSWLARLALKFEPPRQPTIRTRRRSWKEKLNRYATNNVGGHMGA